MERVIILDTYIDRPTEGNDPPFSRNQRNGSSTSMKPPWPALSIRLPFCAHRFSSTVWKWYQGGADCRSDLKSPNPFPGEISDGRFQTGKGSNGRSLGRAGAAALFAPKSKRKGPDVRMRMTTPRPTSSLVGFSLCGANISARELGDDDGEEQDRTVIKEPTCASSIFS